MTISLGRMPSEWKFDQWQVNRGFTNSPTTQEGGLHFLPRFVFFWNPQTLNPFETNGGMSQFNTTSRLLQHIAKAGALWNRRAWPRPCQCGRLSAPAGHPPVSTVPGICQGDGWLVIRLYHCRSIRFLPGEHGLVTVKANSEGKQFVM